MNRLSNEIRIYLSLILKLMQRDQEERLAAQVPGVTGLQFGTLRILQTRECALVDLSKIMMVAPPTLIPALDRLERAGYIQRVKNKEDRRKNNLVITADGIRLLEQTVEFHDEDLLTNSIQTLGLKQSEELKDHLQDLLRIMSPESDLVSEVLSNMDHQEQAKEE